MNANFSEVTPANFAGVLSDKRHGNRMFQNPRQSWRRIGLILGELKLFRAT